MGKGVTGNPKLSRIAALWSHLGRIRLTLLVVALLGLLLVVGAFLFLQKAYGAKEGAAIDSGAVTLLIVGLSALIVVEVLPTLKDMTFGKDGVALSFRELGEKVTNDTSDLARRVAELERIVAALPQPAPPAGPPVIHEEPKDLRRRGKFYDDPRKGRFGGKSESEGFTLSAVFPGKPRRDWAEVILTVEAKAGTTADCAEFFLHDSFDPDEVVVPFVQGKAELRITTWGGFTVGVWICGEGISLELDLALLPDAPKVIKEL